LKVLRFDSPTVSVLPTNRRVKGSNPPCGGYASLDDGVAKVLGFLTTITASTVSPAAGVIVGAISAAILKAEWNQYQTNANCSPVCTIIPADVPANEYHIEYLYQQQPGKGEIVDRQEFNKRQDWAFIEEPISKETTFTYRARFARSTIRARVRDKERL
jgi:hypothetical protein